MILDGKKYREELIDEYKEIIEKEKLDITLAIILVGNDEASLKYVKNKIKYCSMVNIRTKMYYLNSNDKEEDLINLIKKLNEDDNITGIILQSPTPKGFDFEKCSNMIKEEKDIDGFTSKSIYNLYHNKEGLVPCTALGVLELLKHYNIKVAGKRVVIVGRGNITGKPLAMLLTNNDATVTLCHSKTKDLKNITKEADILISATGKNKSITKDMVKEKAIIIDIGTTVIDGKSYGDVDFENVKDIASFITPVPGGVGPMTISMIIRNLIYAKRKQNGSD